MLSVRVCKYAQTHAHVRVEDKPGMAIRPINSGPEKDRRERRAEATPTVAGHHDSSVRRATHHKPSGDEVGRLRGVREVRAARAAAQGRAEAPLPAAGGVQLIRGGPADVVRKPVGDALVVVDTTKAAVVGV